jgi:hypothetical protein
MAASREMLIGHQVLSKVDSLIEMINVASSSDPELKAQAYEQGCLLTRELVVLLEQIIGPQEEYLNQAVRELINQRLTDQRLINDFDEFFNTLDSICRQVQQEHQQRLALGKPDVRYQPTGPEANLNRVLAMLFPNEQVLRNYNYRGVCFFCFLPGLKLALDLPAPDSGDFVRKEYFCRKDGIRLVQLSSERMSNYRELLRDLRRQLQ